MVEVKIMESKKLMVMPLVSDKWHVCACIMMCGDASKKIDDFFFAFFGRDIISPK